jgi:predicted nuclease of predicted toxin-antitoxin system
MGARPVSRHEPAPAWVEWFKKHCWPAAHWSAIAGPRSTDRVILSWTRDHGHVLFTRDLEFSAILASSHANTPSMIQFRARDVTPDWTCAFGTSTPSRRGRPSSAVGWFTFDERTQEPPASVLPSPKCLHEAGGLERIRGHCREPQ